MRPRRRDGLILWFFFLLLPMVIVCFGAEQAVAETITFEEPIFSPNLLTVQYCDKGVEFLEPARIFEPTVETSSEIHAVTNDFGGEFGETRVIKIRFTTPQSEVSVNAGLDREYTAGVYAFLLAFDTENPGTTFVDPGFVGFDTVILGVEPTPINQLLSVTSDQKNIRSVSVIFTSTVSNVGDIPRFELIDDLTFTDLGPPCTGAGDNVPPNITIFEPTNQEVITNPLTELRFEVHDSQSGVAAIQVSFYNTYTQPYVKIDSFNACGEEGPPCIYDDFPSRVSWSQKVHIPFGTSRIVVTAWDFAGNDAGVYRLISFIPPGKDINLWAKAMEITQAVQPWLEENLDRRLQGDTPPTFLYPHYAHVPPKSVPLVAGRTTVVRLFGGVEGTTFDLPLNDAKAALRCYQDPHYLNPCPAPSEIMPEDRPPWVKPEITLTPGEDIDTMRRNVDLTWNFVLPEAWTQQERIYLEGEVIPPQGLSECAGCGDAANRIRVSEIVFNPMPRDANQLIHVVRIRRDLDGQITYPSQSKIDYTLDSLGKVLPIDEGTLPGYANETITFFDDASQDIKVRSSRVLDSLPVPIFTNVLGLIDDGFGGYVGLGRVGEGLCYAKARDYGLTSASHELGHAIGLLHAGPPPGHGDECIDADFCESSWPWPHGTTGAFGFDVFDMVVFPPGTTESDPHDFMSYGTPNWVSPRTWIRFFNNFSWSNNWPVPTASIASGSNENTDTNAVIANDSTPQYLVVRGQQEEISGAWNLLPVYEMDLPQEPQFDNEVGEYSIELLDSGGQILFLYRFPIQKGHFDTEEADGTNDIALAPLSFVRYIPSIEGAVSLRFKKNDETLATIKRTQSPPTLEIRSPNSNGMDCTDNDCQIRWYSEDSDGDPLYFMVQYTTDSGDMDQALWKTLAGDLTAEVLNISMEDLSGGRAWVRVLATDGFNTTVAVSDPFLVADKPPRARILESDDIVVTNEGNRRRLQGSASDMEDGLLGPDRLSWHSNLDGPVGTGYCFNTTQLTPGTHLITLKAEDSQGQYGEDTIELDIIEKLNTQPTADAGPDISALPGGTVLLDGSGSQDPDGDVLVFHWQITDRPVGSQPVLTSPDAMQSEISTDMEGEYTVELNVHDGKVSSLPDRAVVTFVNRPPVAVCRDITVNADDFCQGDGSVDGGSHDPDNGDVATMVGDPAGPYDLGSTVVTLTITDSFGLSDSCTGEVTVKDATPPDIGSLSVSPDVLWPPDHKMVPVAVSISVSDNCDEAPACRITSVSSNEPGNALGDGNTAPDWEITGGMSVNLRSERSGKGNGRTYTITVECTDASGNSSTGETVVFVPHDRSKVKEKSKK
jgi:hypothetical protein